MLLLVGMVLVAAGTGLCEFGLVAVKLVLLLQLLEGTCFAGPTLRVAEAVKVVLFLVGMVLVAAGTGLCEIVVAPLPEGTGFVEGILVVVPPLVGMVLVAAVLVDGKLEQLAVEVDAKLVQLFLHGGGFVLTTLFEPTTLVVEPLRLTPATVAVFEAVTLAEMLLIIGVGLTAATFDLVETAL